MLIHWSIPVGKGASMIWVLDPSQGRVIVLVLEQHMVVMEDTVDSIGLKDKVKMMNAGKITLRLAMTVRKQHMKVLVVQVGMI